MRLVRSAGWALGAVLQLSVAAEVLVLEVANLSHFLAAGERRQSLEELHQHPIVPLESRPSPSVRL